MPRIEPGPGGQDHHTSLKIGGLQPKQSRKMFERIQIMKKSRSFVLDYSDSIHRIVLRVFVIEQFGIRRRKANENTNLMISKHLKIGQLQPE